MIKPNSFNLSIPNDRNRRTAFDAGRRYALRNGLTAGDSVNYLVCIASLTYPETLALMRLKTEEFGNYYRAGFFAQCALNREASV
jgi:hypothetical protein